jgi:hypothetical protein
VRSAYSALICRETLFGPVEATLVDSLENRVSTFIDHHGAQNHHHAARSTVAKL